MQDDIEAQKADALFAEQETTLSPEDIAKATHRGVIVPPGAMGVLFNRMPYMWIQVTDSPNDPMLNRMERVQLPATVDDMKKPVAAECSGELNCVAFSHLISNAKEFAECERVYRENKGINPRMDGIMFDKRSDDILRSGCDTSFACDDAGNIVAVFIMQRGWIEAQRAGRVCHMCGRFPTTQACPRCRGAATFCSEYCYMRATIHTRIHSDDVCRQFLKKLVSIELKTAQDRLVVAKKHEESAAAEKVK
jgi:hypothetical protein